MADKFDRMLEDYFLGKYPSLIQLRQIEIDMEHMNDIDENIGGGRAQNRYSNPIEAKIARYEQDEQLTTLKSQEFLIGIWFGTTSPERQEVIRDKYRNRHTSWEQVAQAHHINERTAREWRDDFKSVLREWIK